MQPNRLHDTNNGHLHPFQGWMSLAQVESLLVQVQMFANANGKNGLTDIAGANYGERAQTMINASLSSKSMQEAVQLFKEPLEEYLT